MKIWIDLDIFLPLFSNEIWRKFSSQKKNCGVFFSPVICFLTQEDLLFEFFYGKYLLVCKQFL